MRFRKAVSVSCIIFFGMIILCLYMPALSQYLPWSWPPASPFHPISQIPLYNWPQPNFLPTAGPLTTSGWPLYSPPPSYTPPPQPAATTGSCPVGLVTGLTLDEEFGPGAGNITRCIIFNYGIKVLVRLNHMEYYGGRPITRPILTMIDDYRITHGTNDFKIAAVVHAEGLPLVLNRNIPDPHPEAFLNDQQPVVEDLIARGVKFYL